MRERLLSAALVVGMSGPPVLVVVICFLTLRQHAFLQSVGWDPIGRTETQWPSLLAVGPGGWLLGAAFLWGSAAAVGLAMSLVLRRRSAPDLMLACLCGVLALGLACVAFPADLPGRPESWHATIHNLGYPLIPTSILVGAVVTSRPSTGRATVASRVTLAVIVIAYPLTSVDAIAQLSRYPLFCALMTWVLLVAYTQRAHVAGAQSKPAEPRPERPR